VAQKEEGPRRQEEIFHVTRGCPKCGAIMVLRRSRTNNGMFLGCTGYPDCKMTVAYDELVDSLTIMVKSLAEQVLVYERRAAMRLVRDPPVGGSPKGAA
jgi:ssDNA-binding Zn-finger/Zn-ribbon topoisomerase 1